MKQPMASILQRCLHFLSLGDKSLSYLSPSGAMISVPSEINPYLSLGVDQNSSIQEIKTCFLQRLKSVNRRERVVASLSYFMITSKSGLFSKNSALKYKVAIPHGNIFLFATVGNTQRLMTAISMDKSLLTLTNEHQHTVLYLAARSGYHDTTLALIKAGASVNHQQVDGSTPLHAASFYGQLEIVEMLLEYGADPGIKNAFGSTPVEEARDENIKEVFKKFTEDNILKIIVPIISNKDALNVVKVEYKGELVAKVVYRRLDVDPSMLATINGTWKVGWHGTKSEHLASIFKYGLKPSGTTLPSGEKIVPPPNHFALDFSTEENIAWSKAIFVSPSLLYACNSCYAEEIVSESKRWCVVVMTRVKPGCYTTHPPTTTHEFSKDEPQNSEFRIPTASTETEEDLVLRIEASSNVVVISCAFISASFLEEFNTRHADMKYGDLEKLFCNA